MKKISVIVPCYMVADYLPKCIDSIINQTYSNLDIILVDDGSQDDCPQICDAYAEKDKRIRVVHKENGGLSSARNAGLDIAIGDYIVFVDSDDWLDIRMFETLYRVAIENDADIVSCGINRIIGNKVIPTCDNSGTIRHLSQKEYLELISIPKENIRFEVWNKIYRKGIIEDTRFKVGQIYEDIYFEREISKRIKRVSQINESLYNYVENRIGATNTTFKMARLGVFKELRDFSNDLDEYGYSLAKRRICMFAMDMAQQFYIALNTKKILDGSKSIAKKTIKQSFNSFFHEEKKLPMKDKIFYLSPSLYYVIWRLKNIFSK